jgi:hypothetical protein
VTFERPHRLLQCQAPRTARGRIRHLSASAFWYAQYTGRQKHSFARQSGAIRRVAAPGNFKPPWGNGSSRTVTTHPDFGFPSEVGRGWCPASWLRNSQPRGSSSFSGAAGPAAAALAALETNRRPLSGLHHGEGLAERFPGTGGPPASGRRKSLRGPRPFAQPQKFWKPSWGNGSSW